MSGENQDDKYSIIEPYTFKHLHRLVGFVFDVESKEIALKENFNSLPYEKIRPLSTHDYLFSYSAIVYDKYGLQAMQYHPTIQSLQERLERFIESKRGRYIFCHNSSFDFRFLDMDRLTKKYEVLPISDRPFIYEIYHGGKKIQFLDTLNYFPYSLSDISKFFGIEKIQLSEAEFKNIDNPIILNKLKQRCENDVKITASIVKLIFEKAHEIGYMPVSSPSLAYYTFRSNFLNRNLYSINDEFERDSYFGGRTEVYIRGVLKVVSFDINSSYPNAMLNPLPIAPVELFNDTKGRYTVGRIAQIKVNIPYIYIPPIPYRIDNKLIFPSGKFITTLCEPELVLLDRLDIKYEVLKEQKYYCYPILKEYALKYYELKQKSKKESVEREYYKLLLNSLYGKFGQHNYSRPIKIENPEDLDSLDSPYGFEYMNLNDSFYVIKRGLGKNSVPIASFITSYARTHLYQYFLIAGLENVYYCDTDSLFVDPIAESKLKSYESDKLGDLKRTDITYVELIKPKLYAVLDENNNVVKIKSKGLRIDNWRVFLLSGKVSFKKFATYKEALKFNSKSAKNYIIQVEKEIQLNDDKRIWRGNYSEPIYLNAW